MSFAEELKALALTAPRERDTEDIFNEESAAKVTSASTDYESGLSRRNAVAVDEAKYAGRSVSRNEMMIEDEEFPDEQFELDPDLYEICDEDPEDDGSDEAGGSAHSTEEIEDEEAFDQESDSQYEEGSEDFDEDSHEEDEDAGEDLDISRFVSGIEDRETNDEDKLKNLELSIRKRISTASEDSEDVRKGRSIGNQLKIWDKLLEYRIQFQRVLALANQLPPFDLFSPIMKAFLADSENHQLYRHTVKNIEKSFHQLISIRQQLIDLYPEVNKSLENSDKNNDSAASDDEEIPSDIADSEDDQPAEAEKPRAKKRPAEDNESRQQNEKKLKIHNEHSRTSEDFYRKFLSFRNATIEKWYQRTKLGATNKHNKAGYTALEQPPLKQIEHIMADEERLIERTRLKRSQYQIVGLSEVESGDTSEKRIVPEIFDDDDFYHHLLREVIERKTQNVSDPFEISRHWIEIQKLRSKMKRRVDTKASKGRRIRYDVIPKLVSFMTPHDAAKFNEQARNDLFGSLFGKQPATSKSEIRPKVTKNDMVGFKIFS